MAVALSLIVFLKKIIKMDIGLVHLHNFLRWVILILLIASIVKSFIGWKSKKLFSPADKKMWLFTMIASHITLLLGLYQLVAGRYGILKGFPGEKGPPGEKGDRGKKGEDGLFIIPVPENTSYSRLS